MAWFSRRPQVVEAFQLTSTARITPATWPDWLRSAWIADNNAPNAVSAIASQPQGAVKVCDQFGQFTVCRINDWLIHGNTGSITVGRVETFGLIYQPALDPTTSAV